MSTNTKSELLRKTADEFDELMEKFDRTKENLVAALTKAQLRDEAIAEHVRAFDEGKRIIAELLPIRDNVEAMKNAIVKPVADVIADSSDTNKKFAWAGLIFGAVSIVVSFLLPHVPLVGGSAANDKVIQKLDQIGSALQPAVEQHVSATWQLLLYDRFEGAEGILYEAPRLLELGDVGRSHGYESVGFEPRTDLVYRAVDVPCAKGCRLALEAMVRLQEGIEISRRQISEKQLVPILPIEIQYATASEPGWKPLEPLQSAIKVEWIGKKNQWQVLKTPYVSVPASLGATRARLILRPYQWRRADQPGQPQVSCLTDFDEIKLFASGL